MRFNNTNRSSKRSFFLIIINRYYDNDLSLQMALGNLNVNDKSPVDNFNPENWTVRYLTG